MKLFDKFKKYDREQKENPKYELSEQDKRQNKLFRYDEKKKLIAEINGIKFTCNELKQEYEELAIKISKVYANKFPNLIEYIIDDINDMFGKISKEELMNSLGTPLIDLDTETITYLEQTLDDIHIIEVEFSGILDEFHEICIDG